MWAYIHYMSLMCHAHRHIYVSLVWAITVPTIVWARRMGEQLAWQNVRKLSQLVSLRTIINAPSCKWVCPNMHPPPFPYESLMVLVVAHSPLHTSSPSWNSKWDYGLHGPCLPPCLSFSHVSRVGLQLPQAWQCSYAHCFGGGKWNTD